MSAQSLNAGYGQSATATAPRGISVLARIGQVLTRIQTLDSHLTNACLAVTGENGDMRPGNAAVLQKDAAPHPTSTHHILDEIESVLETAETRMEYLSARL